MLFSLLEITDGTTTATLTDLINYALLGYAPTIAPLRSSELGGRGPYVDVSDTLTFHTIGRTAAEAYAAAATVNGLLDTADRFARGWSTTPVKLRARVQDSPTTYETLILGRPKDEPNMVVDVTQDQHYCAYISEPIQIRFLRRGQWIDSDVPATSGGGVNPAKLTATLGSSANVSSPMKLSLSGFNTATTPTLSSHYLILAPSASDIALFDASLATGGLFTAVADAANKPYNGTNVLRFTPSGTTAQSSGTLTPSIWGSAKRVQLLAVVRNNSPTTNFQLRANITNNGGTVSTPYATITNSSQLPQIISLGVAVAPDTLAAVQLSAIADAASGTLDISHFVVVSVEDERSRVIPIDGKTIVLSGAYSFVVDDRILSAEAPIVRADGAANTFNVLGYHADAMLATFGTTVCAVWLAVAGFASSRWRFTDSSDVIVTNTITATRHTAVLVPQ